MDLEYRLALRNLEMMAKEYLNLQFYDKSPSYRTFVGSRFIWIDRMHIEGDHVGRNTEMIKLHFLFKHLKELREFHKEAYKRSRKLLSKARKEDQYFGARMEVYVAASLVRKNIEFFCGESPDYSLKDRFDGLYIECGSAHITTENTDIIKKISLTVINKCKKPYANSNTLLMLDITNLMWRGGGSGEAVSKEDIREAISNVIDKGGYGSVILMSYGINKEVDKIFNSYIRADGTAIDTRLLKFLNEVFPFGIGAEPSYYTMSIP